MRYFHRLVILGVMTFFLGFFVFNKITQKPLPLTVVEQPEVLGGEEKLGIVSATLVLDFGESKISTYSDVFGKTAFEVLQKVATSSNILLDTKQYDFGIFVKAIGGVENTPELSWIYFVNGKSPDVASDKYELHGGDVVEWRYTKPNY